MSSTALAFKCDELNDLTPAERLTVECWSCDEDNPLAVPPDRCPVCKGTRRAPTALAAVLREIKSSRAEQAKAPADGEMYLEY
jgi:Zn finger protein HypA/HybF involved in hydrogenase expression